MGIQFDDLPSWEFSSVEITPGIYSVKATRDGGVVGESTGSHHETMVEGLRDWALKVDRDLADRDRQTDN